MLMGVKKEIPSQVGDYIRGESNPHEGTASFYTIPDFIATHFHLGIFVIFLCPLRLPPCFEIIGQDIFINNLLGGF